MRYRIKGDSLKEINLEPETEVDEIIRNILIILNSVEGQVPLARGLGLKRKHLHETMSFPALKVAMSADATEKIQLYEPRAEVFKIEFEENHADGVLVPVLEVEI